MVEYDILKLFIIDKGIYNKYYSYIDSEYLKINYSILYKLYNVVSIYYSKYDKEEISFEDIESLYLMNYPPTNKDKNREELTSVLLKLRASEVNKEIIVDLLESHRIRSIANELAVTALEVSEGNKDALELLSLFDKFKEGVEDEIEEQKFVTNDLRELHKTQVAKPGLRWPQNFLNKALGSLRPGDFGFVFARPETGKTTFLAHVATCMAAQTDRPILWFNNEEQGDKVMLRCYSAALGLPTGQLFSDLDKYDEEFKRVTRNNIKIIDEATILKDRVERLCKTHQPSLIIFDQIDKLKGFPDASRRDLEMGNIYRWGRELAKTYAPVIGVCQSDGTGEGVRWLTMSHVADAKTAKQAEADWILGIGKDHAAGMALIRFFNISKNKLIGDSDSNPSLRHGQGQMLIEPEVARYADLGKY